MNNYGSTTVGGVICTSMGVMVENFNTIGSLILIILGILSAVGPWIVKFIKWIKNSLKDNKIDAAEIRDLGPLCDEAKDIYNKIKNELDDVKKLDKK